MTPKNMGLRRDFHVPSGGPKLHETEVSLFRMLPVSLYLAVDS